MSDGEEFGPGGDEADEDDTGIYITSVVMTALVKAVLDGRSINDPVARDFIAMIEDHAAKIASTRPKNSVILGKLGRLYRTLLADESFGSRKDH